MNRTVNEHISLSPLDIAFDIPAIPARVKLSFQPSRSNLPPPPPSPQQLSSPFYSPDSIRVRTPHETTPRPTSPFPTLGSPQPPFVHYSLFSSPARYRTVPAVGQSFTLLAKAPVRSPDESRCRHRRSRSRFTEMSSLSSSRNVYKSILNLVRILI